MDYDCAGCGRPTPAVVGVCPHCRRPNDEREIADALAAARERRSRPRRLAFRAVVLAAAAALVFSRRDALRRGADSLRRSAAELFRADTEPMDPLAAPRSSRPAPDAPRPAAPATEASTPPPEAVLGADDWAFAGRVYDLRTLKPVARAKMIFACPERGLQRSAELDGFGRFAVGLPSGIGEGFTIQVNAPGYDPQGLAEPDVPYAKLSDADRGQLIDAALQGDLTPSRVSEPQGGPRLDLDVFLAPREPQPARP